MPTPTETATETTTVTPTATAIAVPIPGEEQYVYDANGNLVKSMIGDVTTYYAGSTYEKKVVGSERVERKYYFVGSSTIAMRENGVITWLLHTCPGGRCQGDQVNSTTITANTDGSFNSEIRYSAYGEVRCSSGTTVTDKLYTGQRNEAEIGLDYYIARFYDPVIGHFIQPDSLIPQANASASYDRYAYVNGNPVNFNDPSGHRLWDGSTGDTGSGGDCDYDSYAYTVYYELHTDQERQENQQTLETVIDITTTVVGILNEPADWAITAAYCASGDCSPWMLVGLLPVIPSSLGKHVDEFVVLGEKSFKSFKSWNFRKNLIQMTGNNIEDIIGKEAHHIFPQELAEKFMSLGINIHDPHFGSWVDATAHRSWSYAYNQRWKKLLRKNPSKSDIFNLALDLSKEYHFDVFFNYP